jgi:signal transduction histidine kinase
MSYYLSSTIKKPLKKMTDGMERVRQGEEGVRLMFDAKAEFAQIKDIFNLMMERLEKEKAEKLCNERKKNQLLLDLSHDIKTPISTIKSYANALQANLVPEEEKEKIYAMIDVKANRVNSLIEDIFLMLKLDRPEYAVEKEKLDLCELLREICTEYYDEITDRGYDFEIRIPEDRVEVNVDAKLFSRVIGNLLTNAMKYNKTGRYIGIACDLKARIEVLDDGAPIPESLKKSLFDAFVRGDEARTSVGGTGLGLSIAKTIISRHGGRIEYMRKGAYNCFMIQM